MAIVFPVASPTQFGVASLQWGPVDNIARARNPWTLRTVRQVFAGQMWAGALEITPLTAGEGRRLAAWLTSLRRGAGTFLLGDPAAPAPLGAARDTPGTPVVDGGGQSGATLALRGLPADTPGWLLAGDYLQLGGGEDARLYMALEDVDSDAAGEATATIWPDLRSAPADGAAVTLAPAQGVFMTPTNVTRWAVRPSLVYEGVSLEVEEVVT